MTAKQADLVRLSFRQLGPTADRAATLFYNRLFAASPEIRMLFKGDPELQRQKFMHTLQMMVGSLDRMDVLLPEATELGHRHMQFGVLNAHYYVVGQALIEALREELSGFWNAETEAAWQELYKLLARAMKGEQIEPIPVSFPESR